MKDIVERLCALLQDDQDDLNVMNTLTEAAAEIERLRAANERLGRWMSAALDDPNVCAEMKADISAWFDGWLPRLRDHYRALEQARKE